MKVLILGGYGVFGERVARLLLRDGHQVTIAGRDGARAARLAATLGCRGLRLDRGGDLSALEGHEVLVDAAGPFRREGPDPYRLARGALERGLHVLDLSDDAAWCAGMADLDGLARARGLAALSGLSTLPAISSAAVRALAGDARPEVIEVAILPGNRSPRGRAVMATILAQAGQPFQAWRGGAWETTPGWSDPRDHLLPGGLVRQGYQLEVPDTALFPAHFGADSVIFRAGLELAVMRHGLAAFALLRRWLRVPISGPLLTLFKLAADLLSPFGSGTGGMVVSVRVGEDRRSWRLLAEGGDGPFVPAVAVRALLRRPALPPGAGPALEVLTLAEIEAAMADLRIRSETDRRPDPPLFARVLGPAFDALPEAVRATHRTADVARWRGEARVTRGTDPLARLIARAFGFPPAADRVPVEVTKTVTPRGETWERRFGPRLFRSQLAEGAGGMTERFGPFTFRLGLRVEEGALHFPVLSGRLGPLPLPRWLLPVSVARETEEAGRFRFDVRLMAPLTGGLMVHYQGWLARAH